MNGSEIPAVALENLISRFDARHASHASFIHRLDVDSSFMGRSFTNAAPQKSANNFQIIELNRVNDVVSVLWQLPATKSAFSIGRQSDTCHFQRRSAIRLRHRQCVPGRRRMMTHASHRLPRQILVTAPVKTTRDVT